MPSANSPSRAKTAQSAVQLFDQVTGSSPERRSVKFSPDAKDDGVITEGAHHMSSPRRASNAGGDQGSLFNGDKQVDPREGPHAISQNPNVPSSNVPVIRDESTRWHNSKSKDYAVSADYSLDGAGRVGSCAPAGGWGRKKLLKRSVFNKTWHDPWDPDTYNCVFHDAFPLEFREPFAEDLDGGYHKMLVVNKKEKMMREEAEAQREAEGGGDAESSSMVVHNGGNGGGNGGGGGLGGAMGVVPVKSQKSQQPGEKIQTLPIRPMWAENPMTIAAEYERFRLLFQKNMLTVRETMAEIGEVDFHNLIGRRFQYALDVCVSVGFHRMLFRVGKYCNRLLNTYLYARRAQQEQDAYHVAQVVQFKKQIEKMRQQIAALKKAEIQLRTGYLKEAEALRAGRKLEEEQNKDEEKKPFYYNSLEGMDDDLKDLIMRIVEEQLKLRESSTLPAAAFQPRAISVEADNSGAADSAKVKELEKEVKELKDRLKQSEKEREEAREEFKTAQMKANQLAKELAKLKEGGDDAAAEADAAAQAAEEALGLAKMENEDLQKQLEELRRRMAEAEDRNGELTSQLQNSIASLDELKKASGDAAETLDKYNALKKEFDELDAKKQQADADNRTKDRELADLKRELQVAKSAAEGAGKMGEDERMRLEEELRRKAEEAALAGASGGAEAAELQKKLKKALKENDTLREDNEAKAEEIKQLKVAIEELRIRFAKVKEQLEAMMSGSQQVFETADLTGFVSEIKTKRTGSTHQRLYNDARERVLKLTQRLQEHRAAEEVAFLKVYYSIEKEQAEQPIYSPIDGPPVSPRAHHNKVQTSPLAADIYEKLSPTVKRKKYNKWKKESMRDWSKAKRRRKQKSPGGRRSGYNSSVSPGGRPIRRTGQEGGFGQEYGAGSPRYSDSSSEYEYDEDALDGPDNPNNNAYSPAGVYHSPAGVPGVHKTNVNSSSPALRHLMPQVKKFANDPDKIRRDQKKREAKYSMGMSGDMFSRAQWDAMSPTSKAIYGAEGDGMISSSPGRTTNASRFSGAASGSEFSPENTRNGRSRFVDNDPMASDASYKQHWESSSPQRRAPPGNSPRGSQIKAKKKLPKPQFHEGWSPMKSNHPSHAASLLGGLEPPPGQGAVVLKRHVIGPDGREIPEDQIGKIPSGNAPSRNTTGGSPGQGAQTPRVWIPSSRKDVDKALPARTNSAGNSPKTSKSSTDSMMPGAVPKLTLPETLNGAESPEHPAGSPAKAAGAEGTSLQHIASEHLSAQKDGEPAGDSLNLYSSPDGKRGVLLDKSAPSSMNTTSYSNFQPKNEQGGKTAVAKQSWVKDIEIGVQQGLNTGKATSPTAAQRSPKSDAFAGDKGGFGPAVNKQFSGSKSPSSSTSNSPREMSRSPPPKPPTHEGEGYQKGASAAILRSASIGSIGSPGGAPGGWRKHKVVPPIGGGQSFEQMFGGGDTDKPPQGSKAMGGGTTFGPPPPAPPPGRTKSPGGSILQGGQGKSSPVSAGQGAGVGVGFYHRGPGGIETTSKTYKEGEPISPRNLEKSSKHFNANAVVQLKPHEKSGGGGDSKNTTTQSHPAEKQQAARTTGFKTKALPTNNRLGFGAKHGGKRQEPDTVIPGLNVSQAGQASVYSDPSKTQQNSNVNYVGMGGKLVGGDSTMSATTQATMGRSLGAPIGNHNQHIRQKGAGKRQGGKKAVVDQFSSSGAFIDKFPMPDGGPGNEFNMPAGWQGPEGSGWVDPAASPILSPLFSNPNISGVGGHGESPTNIRGHITGSPAHSPAHSSHHIASPDPSSPRSPRMLGPKGSMSKSSKNGSPKASPRVQGNILDLIDDQSPTHAKMPRVPPLEIHGHSPAAMAEINARREENGNLPLDSRGSAHITVNSSPSDRDQFSRGGMGSPGEYPGVYPKEEYHFTSGTADAAPQDLVISQDAKVGSRTKISDANSGIGGGATVGAQMNQISHVGKSTADGSFKQPTLGGGFRVLSKGEAHMQQQKMGFHFTKETQLEKDEKEEFRHTSREKARNSKSKLGMNPNLSTNNNVQTSPRGSPRGGADQAGGGVGGIVQTGVVEGLGGWNAFGEAFAALETEGMTSSGHRKSKLESSDKVNDGKRKSQQSMSSKHSSSLSPVHEKNTVSSTKDRPRLTEMLPQSIPVNERPGSARFGKFTSPVAGPGLLNRQHAAAGSKEKRGATHQHIPSDQAGSKGKGDVKNVHGLPGGTFAPPQVYNGNQSGKVVLGSPRQAVKQRLPTTNWKELGPPRELVTSAGGSNVGSMGSPGASTSMGNSQTSFRSSPQASPGRSPGDPIHGKDGTRIAGHGNPVGGAVQSPREANAGMTGSAKSAMLVNPEEASKVPRVAPSHFPMEDISNQRLAQQAAKPGRPKIAGGGPSGSKLIGGGGGANGMSPKKK